MNHSNRWNEEVGETAVHSLNVQKFGMAGGKVCVVDKEWGQKTGHTTDYERPYNFCVYLKRKKTLNTFVEKT